jgi:hypothetical protein
MSHDHSIIAIMLNRNANSKTAANEMKLQFAQKFVASGNTKVTLIQMFLYYSWFNVTTAFANNALSYKWIDGVEYPIAFTDGNYSISAMSDYMQFIMKQNGHYLVDENGSNVYYISFVENSTYYKTTLTVDVVPSSLPTGWSNPAGVNLTLGNKTPLFVVPNESTGFLIGFSVGTYPSVPQTTQYQVNGSLAPQINPVTSVNVTCSMVNSTYNTESRILYSFAPQVSFGEQIVIEPHFPIWIDAIAGPHYSIALEFYDQDNNPLAIRDPQMRAKIGIMYN